MRHTLVLLRHAQAGQADPDFARPLTQNGRRRATSVGVELGHALQVTCVRCSPALRARETFACAEPGLRGSGDPARATLDIAYPEVLYGASVSELLAVVSSLPEDRETALVVGHNPGLSELVSALCGDDPGPSYLHLEPGDFRVFTTDAATWADASHGLFRGVPLREPA